jgi:hypothetical protein
MAKAQTGKMYEDVKGNNLCLLLLKMNVQWLTPLTNEEILVKHSFQRENEVTRY